MSCPDDEGDARDALAAWQRAHDDACRRTRGPITNARLLQVASRRAEVFQGCAVVVLSAGERDDLVHALLELRRRVDEAERAAAKLADDKRLLMAAVARAKGSKKRG